MRILPPGFVPPCLPTRAERPPSGELWLHEIKHDGFRVIARKDGAKVRLYRRPGKDLTYRFPLIVESLARLRSRSCIIDVEAVACDEGGASSFERIHYRRHDSSVFPYAFDLLELNGDDLRRETLEVRKATLATVLARVGHGIWFNDHIEGDGQTVSQIYLLFHRHYLMKRARAHYCPACGARDSSARTPMTAIKRQRSTIFSTCAYLAFGT
jgi:bifunctional non-homologous end joining protein LigD